MYDFGALLRQERLKKKWTQKKLADLIGVSEATISKYESNQVPPPFEKMRALAVELNISTDVLYGLEHHEKISTYGLTSEQSKIMRELSELFRNQNDTFRKRLTDQQFILIGKIVAELTK